MAKSKKAFVLGLGSQKSGTTWLFEYLKNSVNYAPGFTKEYHVFDFKDSVEQRNKLRQSQPRWIRSAGGIRLLLMRNTNWYYYNYFNSLLAGEKNLTGDITPSYSCLTKDRLNEIDVEFSKQNIEVRPIVLFRDPFDRIKSSVTMNFGTGKKNVGFNTLQDDFDSAMIEYHKSHHCRMRTAYKASLEEAEAVFGDRLGVFFFEELFSDDKVRALSDFCGVAFNPKLISRKVHGAKHRHKYAKETEDIIRRYYSHQYDFFYSRYPQTQELWAAKS